MKFFLLLLPALLFCIIINAQIGKHQVMIGADISLKIHKQELPDLGASSETTQTQVSLIPELSIGLSKNWVTGIGVGYTSSIFKTEYPGQPAITTKESLNIFAANILL